MLKVTKFLLLLAAAAPIWCQPQGGFGRGMGRSPAFQALDADGDGVISAGELAGAAASMKSLDKNGDGRLTEDEVRPQMGGRGERGGRGGRGGREGQPGQTAAASAEEMVQTLMAFDKNGDGQLTREELPERLHGLFDRADADKNGSLTADEIRKAARATSTPSAPAGRSGGAEPNFMRLDPILAALDSNSDGEITAAEIVAAPASLKKLDKNGDGQLSEDEVRPSFGPRRGRGPA